MISNHKIGSDFFFYKMFKKVSKLLNIKIIFILILNKLTIWGRFYNLKKITIKSIVFVCYRFFFFLKPGSKKNKSKNSFK